MLYISKTTRQLAFMLFLSVIAFGCGSKKQAEPVAAKLDDVIMTTMYPTTYMARRIAGGLIPVKCPLPMGADPIFWIPPRDTVEAYHRARLVVLNGAGYEKWVQSISIPESRIIDSADAFRDEFVTYELGVTHSHGPAGPHTHKGTDGHTWMDPNNAIEQARAIADAMKATWPEYANEFDSNLAELVADLRALDTELKDLTPKVESVKLLASHPAYNYIAKRYGWTITNLTLDPETGLDDEAKATIKSAIGEYAGPVILLWESQPAHTDEPTPWANVVFTPAELPGTGEKPIKPDYIDIMHANIQRLADALEQASG
ncbi:MAG TPA: zinc ABC transporter substrate-binding protein [Phycisphaerales bacterium]|nr:zinc ABC transporter substrate-binding protein [Phycisphaerales bacterium]